jgi:hypothetical protein
MSVNIAAYAIACAKIGDAQGAHEWLTMLPENMPLKRKFRIFDMVDDAYATRESGYRSFDISASIMTQRCDFLRTVTCNHNAWAKARGLRDNGEADVPIDVVRG